MKRDDILEIRRQRLIWLKSTECRNRNVVLAEKIEKSESYVSRMLLPADKPQSKSIGEKAARQIEAAFKKPVYWLDGVGESTPDLALKKLEEMLGCNADPDTLPIKEGLISVVGEAVLGADGSIDMVHDHVGWLQIYSGDSEAYALKVRGDSMWPRINSGEYVVVEPNTGVHSGDEVFVRTIDGHNMIKIMSITRDGSYQFASVNNEHRPITLNKDQVEKIHFISAIVKSHRFIDKDQ
jgi:Predicted transcriptional regulator